MLQHPNSSSSTTLSLPTQAVGITSSSITSSSNSSTNGADSSTQESDNVDAEIARELLQLASVPLGHQLTSTRSSYTSIGGTLGTGSDSHAAAATATSSALAALTAALQAREGLSASVAGALEDLRHLAKSAAARNVSNQQPADAAVTAAVAALSAVAMLGADAGGAAPPAEIGPSERQHAAATDSEPAAAHQGTELADCVHAAAAPPPPQQQQLQTRCEPAPAAASGCKPTPKEAAAAPEAAAAAAAALCKPPHTPDTQDTRQRAAAAAQPSDEACPGATAREAGSSAGVAAAAAAVSDAQAAAGATEAACRQQHAELQQLLEHQAAAAAARSAAQAAVRRQLQQQAEAAARAYIEASRICRAWRTYRGSPGRAVRVAAAVVLQCAVRGAAARRHAQQVRGARRLLAGLEAAAASGSLQAVQEAAAAAAAAGLGADGDYMLQHFTAAVTAAAAALQQASEAGSHAAYAAANAAASRFASLHALCDSCRASFEQRQQAAAAALQAAVAARPLGDVLAAVDAGLALGLQSKDLAAAREAAAARDVQAVARLAAASRAAKAAVARLGQDMAAGSTCRTHSSQGGSNTTAEGLAADRHICSMDAHEFAAALARCAQLGKDAECAAAQAARAQCQHQAAQGLAMAAQHASHAAHVGAWVQLCQALASPRSVLDAALGVLQSRQARLLEELRQAAEGGGSAAPVERLGRQAQLLGVSEDDLAAALQPLRLRQAAAAACMQQAAASGTLQQLKDATLTARELKGVDAAAARKSWQVLQERRRDAAALLARSCAACVHATAAWADERVPQQLLQAAQQCIQALQNAGEQAQSATALPQHSGISPPWQQLQQHMLAALRLGLAANVVAAAHAVQIACVSALRTGASMAAVCGRSLHVEATPIDGGGADAAQACDTGPDAALDAGAMRHFWPEREHLPCAHAQQLLLGSAQQAAAGAALGMLPMAAIPLQPPRPLSVAELQLPVGDCAAADPVAAAAHGGSTLQHQLSGPPLADADSPCSPALQRLLQRNAALPLSHLTALDLSLEQLHSLQGLDELCPSLEALAVNMNSLASLRGLQRCSVLKRLSVQDNQLQQFPVLSCHPQLSQLLLDNNSLLTLSPSTAGALHTGLRVLSAANNRLTSLIAGTLLSSSRSSCNGSLDWQPRAGLAAWLPALTKLRLSDNGLHGLPDLGALSSLRHLDVSRNQLTCLQGVRGCHVLQQLDASDNRLSCWPAGLHLPLLHRLTLASNALRTWAAAPPLPHLSHLSLADNRLRAMPELWGLWQLQVLHLGFNQLQDLGACLAEVSAAAPGLQELALHDNPAFREQWSQQQQYVQAGSSSRSSRGVRGSAAVAAAAAAARARGHRPAGHHAGTEGGFETWYRWRVAASLPSLRALDNEALQQPTGLPPDTLSLMTRDGATACSAVAAVALHQQLRRGIAGAPCLAQVPQLLHASVSTCCDRAGLERGPGAAAYPAAWLACLQGCCGRSVPAGHVWLLQVESAWCSSTRAQLVRRQAAEQAAAQRWCSLGATGAATGVSNAANNAAASDDALISLVQKHLHQLCAELCAAQQQLLVRDSSFVQQQEQQDHHQQHQQTLEAAALIMQCSWRAHAAGRLLSHLQKQQLVLREAQAAAAARLAAARAATTIQAAVRGHRVRRRLKAALQAAARDRVAVLRDAGDAAGPEPADELLLTEMAVGLWRGGLPAEALQAQLHASSSSTTDADSSRLHWLLLQSSPGEQPPPPPAAIAQEVVPHAADISQSSSAPGSRGAPPRPLGASAAALAADNPLPPASLHRSGSDQCVQADAGAATVASSAYEARVQLLMKEWGFADKATAEAYLKRQKHTLKAVTRHRLEQQLKDPAARLRRLQTQLSGSVSTHAPATGARTPSEHGCCAAPNAAAAGRSSRVMRKAQSDTRPCVAPLCATFTAVDDSAQPNRKEAQLRLPLLMPSMGADAAGANCRPAAVPADAGVGGGEGVRLPELEVMHMRKR